MEQHKNTSKWWDDRMPEAVNLILKGYGLTELGIHFGKSTAAVSQALHKRGVSINVLRAKNKAECDKHHEEVISLANAMRQNRELRARVAELEDATLALSLAFNERVKRIAELEKTNTFLQEDLNALVAKHGSLHTKFIELEQGE